MEEQDEGLRTILGQNIEPMEFEPGRKDTAAFPEIQTQKTG